jgi:DNA-binding MarR family transcriptional regulator
LRVLDRLEHRGHITRANRPSGRRSVLIELTDSGREAAAVIGRAFAAIEHRALGTVSPEAVAGFHEVLNALTREGSRP